MVIIKRGRVTFYIKDESVVVSNGDFQYSSYNVFALQNRGPFNEFKQRILDSKAPEFSSIVDVVELGVQCGINGVGTRKPSIEGINCEYRP